MYLLLTTAVIGGSFILINRLLRKRFGASGNTAHAVNDGTRYVRLRKMEVKMLTMPKGPYRVCTTTWFEGDHESAAVCLKARLAKLLTANKWLTGHFVKRNSAHYLAYASSVAIDDALRRLFCHVAPEESPLTRTTPIEETAGLADARGWLIKRGLHNRIYALTVVPCRTSPKTKFCVIASIAHVAGDAHTFYALYNYLIGSTDESGDGSVSTHSRSLPELEDMRIHDMSANAGFHGIDYLSETLIPHTLAFVIPMLLGQLVANVRAIWNSRFRMHVRYFLFDPNVIERLKLEAVKQDAGIDFCSTNDIISSWLLSNPRCRRGLMVANLRGRAAGCTDDLAGNYFTNLHYPHPAGIATPGMIRRSVANLTPHPTTASSFRPRSWWFGGGSVFITNWATFASDRITLPEQCREDFHCPLISPDEIADHPAPIILAVIFRARATQLGMVMCGVPNKLDGYAECPFDVQSDLFVTSYR